MYTPGGLLRKPPLKCASAYPRGSHTLWVCSLIWIRSGALERSSSAGVCTCWTKFNACTYMCICEMSPLLYHWIRLFYQWAEWNLIDSLRKWSKNSEKVPFFFKKVSFSCIFFHFYAISSHFLWKSSTFVQKSFIFLQKSVIL